MDNICKLIEFNVYSLAVPDYFDWDNSFLAGGEAVILLDLCKLGRMDARQKIRYEGFLRTVLDKSKVTYSERTTVYYSVSLDGVEPFAIGLYGLETGRRFHAFICEEVEDDRYWAVWRTLSAYGLRLYFR